VDADRRRDYESGDWKPLFSDLLSAQGYRPGDVLFAADINPRFPDAFVSADLSHVILEGQNVSGFDFSGAQVDFYYEAKTIEKVVTYELVDGLLTITSKSAHSFVGTNFTRATMCHARLMGSDCTSATLAHADLQAAKLQACVFTDADLTGADLRNASLRGAILRRTKLAGAQLQGADLTGADLVGADLAGSTIEEAGSLLDARLARSTGLTAEQLARCEERGARLDDPERVPDWAALRATT
jgi:uncharacterized protein YjbI with pentapeptide repeats